MSQLQVTGEAKIRDIQGPVVANSGVITALDGAASQYVRGDGTLADFPTSTGGGSSVSYYLNGSVNQGTFGGSTYYEMSKSPIIGTGTDFAVSTNGLVSQFITDANDPDLLEVPGGNFNVEFYFSVSNNTGNPTVYAELYKYDGTTFTLLGSSQAVPESINQGTTIAPYYFAIPVGTAALALTDRIAIRIYANVDGRTVTLHTENSHLCQVVTTFSKGMVSLNNLTDQSQFITTGTSGTNFNIVSSGDTHTFNLPVASATNTGKLSNTDWSTFNNKVPYTGATGDVNLGLYNISAQNAFLNGVSGVNGGNLFLKQDIDFGQSAGYTTLYSTGKNLGFVSYVGSFTYNALFSLNSLTNNSTRTYTLPDSSGTLALTDDLSDYVPYTGATGNVDLGGFSLYLNNGQAVFGRNFTGTTSYALIGVNPSNKVSIDNSALGTVFGGSLTGQTYIANGIGTQGGTIALKQNGLLSASTGYTTLGALSAGQLVIYFGDTNAYAATFLNTSLTDSRSYTLPNANGTIALTSNLSSYVPYTGATGAVNLGAFDLTVNGLTIGRGASAISSNTVIGLASFVTNTTGSYNVAVGLSALNSNTTGGYNTVVGASAMVANTTGTNNTAVGYGTLNYNSTGVYNIAIGNSALFANTTGSFNTAIGCQSLQFNTTSNNNTAVGYNTLSNTTGAGNTAIGNSALTTNTTGSNNVAVGNSALISSTTSNNNTAIGVSSLTANTTGTQNTAIGINSGVNNTTGSGNNFIGYNAGAGITTGGGNTILGNAGTLSSSLSNNIILADGNGNIRYQWNGTNNVFGNPISGTSATFSGNVGIGVTLSSWDASFRALQISGGFAAMGNASAGYIFGNAYFDGDSRYFSTGPSARIDIGNGMVFRVAGSGTAGNTISYTPALTLTTTGAATFSSSVTANGLYANAGNSARFYRGANDYYWGVNNDSNNYLNFGTFAANGTAYGTNPKMILLDNGNVGINTSSPAVTLHALGKIRSQDSRGGSFAAVEIYGGDSSFNPYISVDQNNPLTFITGGSERMRITGGGNVGIGTSSPSQKLTIDASNGYPFIDFKVSGTGYGDIGYNTAASAFTIGAYSTTPMAFYTNSAERMRITSGGNVLIGKSTTGVDTNGFRFDSSGVLFTSVSTGENTYYLRDTTNAVYRFYVTSGGTINATNTTISAISDVRLKENITDLQIGLDAIMALRPRQFDWKKESGNSGKNVRGFIAQEFEEVFPDLIDESINKTPEGEPYKQIRQDLIPILVKAIQELNERIKQLENK